MFMMRKHTVVVTDREYEKGKAVFERTPERSLVCIPVSCEESELAAAIRMHGARHVILGVEKYAGELYEALPKGGVIARYGVGYDGIDLARATEKGLYCTSTPGALDDSVAEFAITLMLSLVRHIMELNEITRNGKWGMKLGMEMRGKRLAVIGCGPIGSRVSRIASFGLGMTVIGSEVRDVDRASMKREYGFTAIVKTFEEAVADADFVSLHIPGIQSTNHFINDARLSFMPRKAWLINTSRGSVVDESALYDALVSGVIRGAALDVFENEPYVPVESGKDLRSLRNIIMTPHMSASTLEACNRVAERALLNIELAERKEYEKMDLLNPEILRQE
jgi:lactate dehydrogenase-like 2-hydroxyacid dehydrogenase